MNKKTNKSGTEHVLLLAVKFEPKAVREMSVEEYEAEFDTKFPAPDPRLKPARLINAQRKNPPTEADRGTF